MPASQIQVYIWLMPDAVLYLAVGMGFEPMVILRPHTLSKRALSTTQPPHLAINSKHETRNSKQCSKFEISNDQNCFEHLDFYHLDLFRISIFEFRIFSLASTHTSLSDLYVSLFSTSSTGSHSTFSISKS